MYPISLPFFFSRLYRGIFAYPHYFFYAYLPYLIYPITLQNTITIYANNKPHLSFAVSNRDIFFHAYHNHNYHTSAMPIYP